MADAQEEAPLATGSLAGSEEVLVPSVVPRGSNSRALKVAGLTTLACLLLASQVFMAYVVFDQKQQIHTLQKNSDKLSRQMTRTSQVVPARMPLQSMNSLLMDVSVDQHSLSTKSTTKTSKTPTTPNQQVTDDSVEKQLTDLMKDFKLPQFNETFLANMQSLRKQMNMSDWKTLETWMRNWLIFQTAQQEPAAPTASSIQTKCQQAAGKMLGSYKPQCDEQGRYLPVQCWHATGFCWCVDESGETIQGTEIRGRPTCPGAAAPLAKMAVPSLMQAVAIDEN